MPPTSCTVTARAKVNLFLRILGRRPDGFHDLASIFQAIELADTLAFEVQAGRDDLNLRCTDLAMPDGQDNLIAKAYRLLRERYGDRIGQPGVVCRVEKRIPIGAGLGGGSADAAGALVGLDCLWALGLSREELLALATELGSDVPFALIGGTACVSGRGEVIEPIEGSPEMHFVIAIPPFGVSTAEAYGWWDKAHPVTPDAPTPAEVRNLWSMALRDGSYAQYLHNDFEPLVFAGHPDLRRMADRLRSPGAIPVLTGSGSALITLVADHAAALETAQRYQPVAGERILITRSWTGPSVTVV